MPKGQTSINYDPTSLGFALAERAGGGPQVSDFARSLLTGTPQAAPPAGAPAPGAAPNPLHDALGRGGVIVGVTYLP